MKKIFSTALLLQLLVCALFTPALWAEEKREFISKTMNADVQKLFENCGREIIGAEPFSSKDNNVMDYMIGFYNTDYGLLVTLQTLKQRLDEYGRAMLFIIANSWRLYLLIGCSCGTNLKPLKA